MPAFDSARAAAVLLLCELEKQSAPLDELLQTLDHKLPDNRDARFARQLALVGAGQQGRGRGSPAVAPDGAPVGVSRGDAPQAPLHALAPKLHPFKKSRTAERSLENIHDLPKASFRAGPPQPAAPEPAVSQPQAPQRTAHVRYPPKLGNRKARHPAGRQ